MTTTFRPLQGESVALTKRGISVETCRHFGYTVGEATEEWLERAAPSVQKEFSAGLPIQLAPYRNEEGAIVAQKVRGPQKQFALVGRLKEALPLFGQHLWRDSGKKVVITEGEIDCMTVSQLQGNKWPVVSVPNGAEGAKKSLAAALEWLERFDEVILMFDMDEPGRKAVAECASLFTPGRCKIATLPLKDANAMLQAGRGGEVIEAIWGAKPYRPDGILSVDDLAEEASKDVEWGTPWWLEQLTEWTFGRRDGELYAFGAGTGSGKTDWFTQSIAFDVMELKIRTGVVYLEQPPVETVRRIAGKVVGKNLHIPGEATVEERREAIEQLRSTGLLSIYGTFGAADWEAVKAKIRFMAVSQECRHIYLDHLTALVSAEEDERKALDKLMEQMASLALELKVKLHFISHLTRPEGTPHEEGGRVMVRHFRGSNAIGMWSHFMFGIERNQQAETPEEALTTFRVLKDRNTGRSAGKTLKLAFDPTTGLLSHVKDPMQFTDQTSPAPSASNPSSVPPWQDDDIPF